MNVKTVLFLCSGNYYRSRFAEGFFNHLAPALAPGWRARSAGLRIDHTRTRNIGPLSPFTLRAFRERSIACPEPLPFPAQVTREDLEAADLIIALKEAEHRAMLRNAFPEWENRVTYWHVHDLDFAPPEQALNEVETLVRQLLVDLQGERQNTNAATRA
jgi:protein-tyrosine phosphatase